MNILIFLTFFLFSTICKTNSEYCVEKECRVGSNHWCCSSLSTCGHYGECNSNVTSVKDPCSGPDCSAYGMDWCCSVTQTCGSSYPNCIDFNIDGDTVAIIRGVSIGGSVLLVLLCLLCGWQYRRRRILVVQSQSQSQSQSQNQQNTTIVNLAGGGSGYQYPQPPYQPPYQQPPYSQPPYY